MSSRKQYPASARRRQKAREKGDVAQSRELVAAVGFLCLTSGNYIGMFSELEPGVSIRISLGHPQDFLTNNVLLSLDRAVYMLRDVVVPPLLFLCGGALLTEVAQLGFHLNVKPVSFQWSRLNPVHGLKRMLGSASSADGELGAPCRELLKALLFASVIGTAWIGSLFSDVRPLGELLSVDAAEIGSDGARARMSRVSQLLGRAAWVGSIAALACGIVHLHLVRRSRERRLRMTRDELRQEQRESEGDPETKMLRRQLHQELLTRDLVEGVRSARAVIVDDG